MKYCLISAHHFRSETEKPEEELVISGLYQWGQAFKKYDEGGDYVYIPELQGYQIEEYDLIHLNMTVNNQTILSEIRDKIGWNSPSKVICNVDISAEMWQGAYGRLPLVLLREIDKADMLFSVEPVAADILSSCLSRDVFVLPHPVPVERIREQYLRYDRNGAVAVIYHRYQNGEWLMPYLAMRGLDVHKWLLGWVGGDVGDKPDLLYNQVLSRLEFDGMMNNLAVFSIAMDLFGFYAYGRFPIECGALGIPCITSERVAASDTVHPDLKVNPMDVRTIRSLVIRLLSDSDFWESCANRAFEGANDYSLERSHEKMVEAVSGEAVTERREKLKMGAPLVLPRPSPDPDWEFDSNFRKDWDEAFFARAFKGKGRWEPPRNLDVRTNRAMKWCLAHGYGSCYSLNGKVYLPGLSDLAKHVLTKIPEDAKDEPILDAGCFQGVFAISLVFYHGYTHIDGLDVSEASIARAERNLGQMRPYLSEHAQVSFKCGDVENPAYEKEAFGTVICMETLEHVRHPEKAVKKLFELVRPGGRLIVTVPDRNSVESPYHINYFFLESDEERLFALKHRRHNLETMLHGLSPALEVESLGPYLVAVLVKQ